METRKPLRLKRIVPEDELALLARARAGDGGAVDDLVRAHYPDILRAACHLLGNADDGADLAQDCFVKALAGLRRTDGQGSLRAWLRCILVHLARDRFRARARRPSARSIAARDDDFPAPAPGPDSAAGRAELSRLVEAAIEELPSHLRVPLVLRAVEGWSYEEIAAACGVTPATARTQVMKARRRLHGRIGGLFEEDPS